MDYLIFEKQYVKVNRKYLERKRRYTHQGYTHYCGAHFDSIGEAWLHMQKNDCESLLYKIFSK